MDAIIKNRLDKVTKIISNNYRCDTDSFLSVSLAVYILRALGRQSPVIILKNKFDDEEFQDPKCLIVSLGEKHDPNRLAFDEFNNLAKESRLEICSLTLLLGWIDSSWLEFEMMAEHNGKSWLKDLAITKNIGLHSAKKKGVNIPTLLEQTLLVSWNKNPNGPVLEAGIEFWRSRNERFQEYKESLLE